MNQDEKKGVVWNVLGSVANASASVVLLLVVTRICGTETAGIFSIAFVTAQMLMNIGNYGVRAYQVSDQFEKYNFREYEINRYITCFIMILSILGFIWVRGYGKEVAVVVFFVGIWKMLDSLADVYEGRLQQKDKLELAGKSLFYRTVVGMLFFCMVLLLTHNLLWASIGAIIGSGILLFLLACRPARKVSNIKKEVSFFHVFVMLKECFPLFISLILLAFVINIPKYAIEDYMSYDKQTYYNIIYMPAQVIYLLATFIFKPFLTHLTTMYHESVLKFKRSVLKLVVAIPILTGMVILVAYIIGIPVLQLLYGVELEQYKTALMIVLLGGGFNAVSSLLYYMLTIMRKQYVCMFSYIAGMFVALVASEYGVKCYGIMGAAGAYLFSMIVISVIMLSVLIFSGREKKSR